MQRLRDRNQATESSDGSNEDGETESVYASIVPAVEYLKERNSRFNRAKGVLLAFIFCNLGLSIALLLVSLTCDGTC